MWVDTLLAHWSDPEVCSHSPSGGSRLDCTPVTLSIDHLRMQPLFLLSYLFPGITSHINCTLTLLSGSIYLGEQKPRRP